jgi:hypothetical protein
MRRALILGSLGLAAVVIALLYVGNGSSSGMVWTYQKCVETRVDDCNSSSPLAARCSHVSIGCARTEPRLQPWVVAWLIESAIAGAVIATAAVVAVKSRKL